MFSEKLNFHDLAQRLDAATELPQDLWPRIAQAHVQRRRRRFRVRLAGVMLFVLTGSGALLMLPQPAGTDWQARAQALEIELHGFPADIGDPAAREARSGLERVDSALQSAYDRGARTNELVPLWKERSELLSTLLAVRQQSAAITRI